MRVVSSGVIVDETSECIGGEFEFFEIRTTGIELALLHDCFSIRVSVHSSVRSILQGDEYIYFRIPTLIFFAFE